MYQIDFLPVENENQDSQNSGDAIAMRFTVPGMTRPAVVVVDAGYTATGDELVDHIAQYYDTDHVDLVISTHPDSDHVNGLTTVLERLSVGELLMHTPWAYRTDASNLGNYEKIRELADLAAAKKIPITQPFTGVRRLGGAVTILGPSEQYYQQLLNEALDEVYSGKAAERQSSLYASGGLMTKLTKAIERTLAYFPIETLSNADETSPRNKMSVVTLLNLDGERKLLTGDAGIPSLEAAADYYELNVGPFASNPLSLFQAPHHGSHRNVGPDVLDRILGTKDAAFSATTGIVSSAKSSEKHPSPRVTNALGRRGANVYATEGKTILHHGNGGARTGWSSATKVGPLVEDLD